MKKRTVAIIGTGMIASSMAALCAGHGFHTRVLARSAESEKKCRASVDAAYADMTAQGLMIPEQADVCRTYIHFTNSYADLSDAEICFEAIVEDVEKKHGVYWRLEENCPELKAICSVSSSITADVLSDGVQKYGDRIIVTHPFNPAHMVPYFEICAHAGTAEGVVDYVKQVLTELDRKPVVLKKPTPGFIGNRLQFALLREAIHLVESGIADPRDVDTCLMYSFFPRYTSIGIFEHFDNGGMNLCSTVAGNLFPLLSDEKEVPKMLRDLMEQGRMGAANGTGEGFYDWRGVDMDAYRQRVSEPYWRFCAWELPEEKDGE